MIPVVLGAVALGLTIYFVARHIQKKKNKEETQKTNNLNQMRNEAREDGRAEMKHTQREKLIEAMFSMGKQADGSRR